MRHFAGLFVAFAVCTAPAVTQDADLRAVFTAPIGIERAAPVTSVPIEVRMGKLFVEAAVNGQWREFMFDTGSPTILTRAFADTLDLEIVGRNTGVDANGNAVTMDVAVIETLAIGDTVFSGVPVLIHDYAQLDMGACFVDGGMIGSELLPGSAWRIDTQAGQLGIAQSAGALGGGATAIEARLYDFGYPHMPIVDYALGDVSDKALFDTGNSEQVTLFAGVLESRSAQRAVERGSTRRGHGYEGESAGGRGEAGELVRFTLADFQLDGEPLGTVRATTRSVPPSLVGAGMLASHIVTLDYPGERFLLEARSESEARGPEAGYAIAFAGDAGAVVQLFEDSPAAAAGLELGDRVTAIDGRSLVVAADNPKCDTARWLAESFDAAAASELVVEREGAAVTLHVPAAQP